MISQDIIFVAVGEIDQKSVEFALRRSIYTLRDYSFKKNIPVRIAFCSLMNRDDIQLSFYNMDEFAFKSGVSYFATSGKIGLYDYLDERRNGPLPLVVYLGGGKNEITEKAVNIAVKENEWQTIPKKLEKALNRPSPLKKKVMLWSAVVLLALFAILCAFISYKIKHSSVKINPNVVQENKIDYVRVYTGDGDRLILRVAGEEDAPEIMRINEDEVLARISDNGVWTEVEYHGLHGYVHSQWLKTTYEKNKKTYTVNENNYEITDTAALYAFGKAALEQGYTTIGTSYIQKAADANLVSAKWELYKQNNDIGLLKEIDKAKDTHEEKLITYYEKRAEVEEKVNKNKTLADKFRRLAFEQRQNESAIKRQAAKKLSEYYMNKGDVHKAAEYYETAIERGLKGDDDYMYNLAKKFDPNLESAESRKWYEKTSYYVEPYYDYYYDWW
ncbi:MAG: hypothetical protein J6Y16_02340 [Treponema sp.]|nr:hypothetical protein [Treponema sp.]